MDVHRSARKHGVSDADIHHAFNHQVARYEISDDDGPTRFLLIGADRAANLLEVVVIERDDGTHIAIHAMPLRPSYRHLLPAPPERDTP